jgi:cell division protein ZapA
MAQVEVTVNGRQYIVACEDGKEEHLLELADYLDRSVAELVQSIGQVGEARLMLMAGLLIADELFDSRNSIIKLESELAGAELAGDKAVGEVVNAANTVIERITSRLDNIAERLQSA